MRKFIKTCLSNYVDFDCIESININKTNKQITFYSKGTVRYYIKDFKTEEDMNSFFKELTSIIEVVK